MLQTIAGKLVYVVEFDTMPELPITGMTQEEADYENILVGVCGKNYGLAHNLTNKEAYAWILTQAIETGVITKPGKYGLHKDYKNNRWEVYGIPE